MHMRETVSDDKKEYYSRKWYFFLYRQSMKHRIQFGLDEELQLRYYLSCRRAHGLESVKDEKLKGEGKPVRSKLIINTTTLLTTKQWRYQICTAAESSMISAPPLIVPFLSHVSCCTKKMEVSVLLFVFFLSVSCLNELKSRLKRIKRVRLLEPRHPV